MSEHSFGVDLVDLDSLIPHDENPNRGDVLAIAQMIAVDGWHGQVMVQAPKGRRKRPRIFAGEHRWRALTLLNEEGIDLPDRGHVSYADLLADKKILVPPAGKVPAQVLPLEDLIALRKLAGDNRAATLASPDEVVLAALLQRLDAEDSILGSGYTGDDLGDMLRGLDAGPSERGNIAEARTPADRAADYAASTVRALILPFASGEYDRVVAALDKLGKAREVDSHSAIIAALVLEAAEAEEA